MGYAWIFELGLFAAEMYFDWKARRKKTDGRDETREEHNEKPLPRIVGSVPYVPLKQPSSRDQPCKD